LSSIDEQTHAALLAALAAPEGQNPRTCNTGVPNANPPGQTSSTRATTPSGEARFDYYRATKIQATLGELIEGIEHHFGEGIREGANHWKPARPFYGYAEAIEHQLLSLVIFHGNHDQPCMQVSGSDAPAVVDWLRACEIVHNVSRADVCWDFSAEGSFEAIEAIVKPIARTARAQVKMLGDPDVGTDDKAEPGRTLYLGSRQSDAFIRLYEKGIEQQAKGNPDADPNWVRLEVQIQPRKARKRHAATLSPRELVAFSKWINDAVEATVAEHATFIPDPSLRQTKDDSALAHMASQYGRVIRARVEAIGWEAFNLEIYRAIYTAKERAKMESRGIAPEPFRRAPQGSAKPAIDLVEMIERQHIAARG